MSREKYPRKLRVLGITGDQLFVKCLRLEMPLLNLKKNGVIDSFFITDSYLTGIPEDASFNVLWLLRVANKFLIRHLAEKVNNQYLYDLDDLLIAKRVYGEGDYYGSRAGVIQALNNCEVLTVTSQRLCSLLERYAQLPLAAKVRVCPNGFEFSGSLRVPQVPGGILWTSSDAAALTSSREPVVKAIARFAQKHDLTLYSSGFLNAEIKGAFRKIIDLGQVSYWHHKVLLASLPAMIGVAPLETQADGETLDFINGKSDVKMVEFGGLGHPGVYSHAPPYADTDLHTGVLVANTEAGWMDGLEAIFRQGWQQTAQEQRDVIELRQMDRLTRECWSRALEPVILERPLSGKELKQWKCRSWRDEVMDGYLKSDFLRKVKGKLPEPVTNWVKKMIGGGS
jgi:hypothetical protein